MTATQKRGMQIEAMTSVELLRSLFRVDEHGNLIRLVEGTGNG